jgi:6,7-dimethyl-8-ribityllumazine synthase
MKTAYTLNDLPRIPAARVAILQSKWHRDHTDRMVEKCVETLRAAEVTDIEQFLLPGSLELPIAAKILLQKDKSWDALVAIGIVVKGDTYHFEMVTQQTFSGLQQVALEFSVPIINEVLPVTSIDQVIARTGDNNANKGYEAGIAVAEMIAWKRKVEA